MRNFGVVLTALMHAAVLAPIASAGVPKEPTYATDVAAIMNAKCVSCHRPGEIAPMSLTTYDEVRPWAKAIAKNVSERVMPPWHADKGIGVFQNDRSLNEDEIATIVRWVDQGAQQGDPKETPPSPDFPAGEWKLGEPDLVATLDEVKVPAGGPDQFYNPKHHTNLPADQWIRAVEIRPSNRKVTHHVIVYQTESEDGQPNGWLGAWAPGAEPMEFPKGTGRLLKKNGILVGDVHYHPVDTPQTDQTRVGLYFAPNGEIEKEVVNLWMDNRIFEIPAGASNFEATSTYTFPQDSIILSVMPHMHYRGKSFKYIAKYPNGRSAVLMSTSDYDFNWQTNYIFKKPIKIPGGTQIDCIATWDNSANNPSNPDPAKNVTFGNASTDEMMIGFVDYIVAKGLRPASATDAIAEVLAQLAAQHPGDTYDVVLLDNASEPRPAPSALFLPHEGDGELHLSDVGRVFDGKITEIVWNGNSVKARAEMGILGSPDFEATVDEATGDVKGTLYDKKGLLATFQGTRVVAANSSE